MRFHVPRLVLLVCVLALALVPSSALAATHARAAYPTISKVSPLKAGVGDTMTINGSNFRKGKNKNTVVFKRDGARAVFMKIPLSVSTKKLSLVVPAKLLPFMLQKKGVRQPTRFRLRVLASRFGKTFTSAKLSPTIGPKALGTKASSNDCDGDGTPNSQDSDDDNDLIPDTTETAIGTDPCKRDTDGDGMSDGWEYYSSLDRNGKALPSPSSKPYPNALNAKDGDVDNDGDGLTNMEEYTAWATTGGNKLPLNYSGGNPASAGRGAPPAGQEYMDRDHNGFLSDYERDADGDGIPNMDESIDTLDRARITKAQAADDPNYYDFGLFTQPYIDLAMGQTKQDQPLCGGINQIPFYCLDQAPISLKVEKVDTLDWLTADSDGDGIRDDQDDVDHDDVPNIDEYLAEIRAPFKDRHYAQIDACYPNSDSRFCVIGGVDIDGDGLPNSQDTDDDGDGLPDTLERQIGTDPLRADTDGDKVTDGFEYWSARDLNNNAVPFPGKAPYPNPLDGSDANTDFDGDTLSLLQEYKAWNYSGRPQPLNYSDGNQYTGGKIRAALGDVRDIDGNGYISDEEKDVDGDGLSNFDETHGAMTMAYWSGLANASAFTSPPYIGYLEQPYPYQGYLEPSFVDPDSDGDGVVDGDDDQDHDGYPNWFEAHRPSDWRSTYTSVRFPHGTTTHNNPLARVNPFNPCKPIYSDACHTHPPAGYYAAEDDWQSDTHPDSPWLPALPPKP